MHINLISIKQDVQWNPKALIFHLGAFSLGIIHYPARVTIQDIPRRKLQIRQFPTN
jgi:hypothetical protein